ncbi:MAG: hypothetical protein AAF203_05785 [Pseudomonadota bacterium]
MISVGSILMAFLFAQPAGAMQKTELFGASFEVHGSKALEKDIVGQINKQSKKLSGTLDPDCFYKTQGNKSCGKKVDRKLLRSVTALANDVETETVGNYNHETFQRGKTYRDFGGLSQGVVLDRLAKKHKTGWIGNFAGDIYIAPNTRLNVPLKLAHPLRPGAFYADIQMKAGWMMQSSASTAGGVVRNPINGKSVPGKDFLRISLFAKPSFNGARLDAWSTALTVGGKRLLDRLWKDKKYRDQWGYSYFDQSGNVVCSKNLKCDLAFAGRRKITIPW